PADGARRRSAAGYGPRSGRDGSDRRLRGAGGPAGHDAGAARRWPIDPQGDTARAGLNLFRGRRAEERAGVPVAAPEGRCESGDGQGRAQVGAMSAQALAAPFPSLAIDEAARLSRTQARDDDREAIEASQRGDRAAFDRLVERYQRDVYRLCY